MDKLTERAASYLVAALLALPGPIAPATITVDGNDSSITPGDGICGLREAINNANSDSDTSGGDCVAGAGADTIVLTTDVTLTVVDNSTGYALARGLPVVSTDITVEGGGFSIERDSTAPQFGIFAVMPTGAPTGALSLNNTTVSGGNINRGGGIYNHEGTTILTNTTVSDNYAFGAGGGIWSWYGNLELIESLVSGNSTDGSGGGITDQRGTTALTHSTVSGNYARSSGGGIRASNGILDLRDSTVSGNSVNYDGGGIATSADSTTITNSTISGNVAGRDSGGIEVSAFDGSMTLINSTVSGNSANRFGGINSHGRETITLIHSTVSGNSGPAVFNRYGTPFTLIASIVAGDESLDCQGYGCNDGGGNFSEDGTCPGSPITPGVDFDTALADNGGPTETHALLTGSVAINAAGDCGLETDQRGVPRDDGSCDSGSFEFNLADEIPCEDIAMFQSRCRARTRGNFLESRILMTDTSHDGERVWVAVDGSPMAMVISGDKAQGRVRRASSGRHRVALLVPTGCFAEKRVRCP